MTDPYRPGVDEDEIYNPASAFNSKDTNDPNDTNDSSDSKDPQGEKRKSGSDNEEVDEELSNFDSYGIPLSFTDRHSRAEGEKERIMEKKW